MPSCFENFVGFSLSITLDFSSWVMGTRILTGKSQLLLVITICFIKEDVWSLYRFLFFDTLIPPSFVISFFWTLCLLTGSFQNRSLTHLRCSPWPFGPTVTLSVALLVEFSFCFSHIFGPTGFFLFSTFSIFSCTRFLFYTFLLYQNWITLRSEIPVYCLFLHWHSRIETFGL